MKNKYTCYYANLKTNTHVITQIEKLIHMLLHKVKNKYTCYYANLKTNTGVRTQHVFVFK